MRRCKTCGKRKPLDKFVFGTSCHRRECHECRARWDRDRTRASRTWLRSHCRDWYRKNRKLLQTAKDLVKHPQLNPYYRARHDAFLAYGGYRCACCKEDEPIFLTLDHMNNDGNKDRKRIGNGIRLFTLLRRQGYPPGFQVLCFNCNCGRHRNGGVCPHHARKRRRRGGASPLAKPRATSKKRRGRRGAERLRRSS
jgi:hypothetical protein